MIPKQLQQPEFRFIRLGYKSKIPIKEEEGWRKRAGLTFDSPILLDHIKYKNYAVCGGYGDLCLIDSDIPLLAELIEKKFGETFRVQSGSGRGYHDYYKVVNAQEEQLRTMPFKKDGKHYGELRAYGCYVVGSGSLHDTTNGIYKVIKDIPINQINYKELIEYLKQEGFTTSKEKIKVLLDTTPRKDYGESDIQSISLGSVLGTNQERIPNFVHGSTSGTNTIIDYSSGLWFCFRCWEGGGVAQAIGLKEGIISNCEDRLSTDQFIQVLEIARDKYGLKPLEQRQESKPQGWALSIKISKLAQRYNLTNCLTCNNIYTFNDYLGKFNCDSCKVQGNLQGFAKIINKRVVVL